MEINLLVVNVGNSRVAVGAFVAGELKDVARLDVEDSTNLQRHLGEMWKEISGRDNAAIVGASVNPSAAARVGEAVEKSAGRRIVWVGDQIALPIKVKTEPPEQTGVDRIVNIAAAHEQMGKACIVVDAGTAITIDCCNDAGEFIGGAIAPGAKLMLESLHKNTAALPEVTLHRPEGDFGVNTKQAMLQGVYHGIRGMVKELAENYATALGNWPEIIATGGDAKILFEGWDLIHAIAPDLTLYGIALAYVKNDEANSEQRPPMD